MAINPEKHLAVPPSTPSFLLPADLSGILESIAQKHGVDIRTLIKEALELGVKFVTSTQRGAKCYIQQEAGSPLERIVTSPTDFSSITSVARDTAVLKRKLDYQEPIDEPDQNLQATACSLVATAAQKIKERFGDRLKPEHHLVLEQITEGVLVISNLKNTSEPDDSPPNVICHGMVIHPYKTVLFDKDELQSGEISEGEKLHTVAHEVWHILGANALPELLNEALTDMLAERAIGYPADQTRLGRNFRLAFNLLKQLERIAGEEEIFQAYLDSPYTEVTVNLVAGEVTETFIDLPLHQRMRRILGQADQGNDYWNQILNLIDQGKLKEAYALFSKRPLTQKIKEYLQNYSRSFNRQLKPTLLF